MPTPVTERKLEELTQQLGHEMFERMRANNPTIFNYSWWQEKLMLQCMSDEWFKVQAFRFIDALPTMEQDVEVARHLKEYFVLPEHAENGAAHQADDTQRALRELDATDAGFQTIIRWISKWMNFPRLDAPRAKLTTNIARWSSQLMAGSFIAGSNIEEAEQAIRRMRDQQMAFTVDVLGEAAVSAKEAARYHETYLNLITELPKHAANWAPVALVDEGDGRPIPRVNVSVKITSLFPGFDPIAPEAAKARAKELLRPLLRKGMEGGAHVHIDMEHYEIKDLTLELCEELLMEPEFRDYPHFGIVLQAYLKDGDKDCARTVEYAKKRGTPVWVRLVKGAYWDSETVWAEQRHWPCPVWEQKWQSDACYERMTRMMLANHEHISSAFASHNIRSLTHAMAARQLYDVPGDKFELQMLFGMGDPIKKAGVEMGQRCRIYTPYGHMLSGMAYLIRRLLENTANESFLRNSSDDSHDEELLRNPDEIGLHTPPPEQPIVIRYEFEEPIMDPFENVAKTDFSVEPNRQQMVSGLAHVRAELGEEIPLVIGGQKVTTGAWLESVNPSRPKEVIAKVAQADNKTVDDAVGAAKAAYASWRQVAPADRAAYLHRAAELLQEQRFEVAALLVLECGKPWREADSDVSEAIDFCNYYAKEMMRITQHMRRRDIPGEVNEYFYAPRGVVAVLSPFNFPLDLLAGMVAAAVVTGNTVVMKPAPEASAVGARLHRVFTEAGLPDGVLNFVAGPGEPVGAELVKHPDVQTIAFTGSRQTGAEIHKLAVENPSAKPSLKRTLLEMGGKNAIIVDSDADLDEAIKGVLQSAFGYAGQKCSSASRLIVIDPVHDRLMDRLVDAVATKTPGPAEEPTTAIPPLISDSAVERMREMIERGKKEAKCVLEVEAGENAAELGGYYVGPVIFDDVPPDARIAQEETLGPVLCVVRAKDIDEAIAIFNGTDYALSGGIYSRSPANLEKARARCECGNFYINRPITGSRVDLQPFGGLKMSGTGGKIGGPDYLLQFCDPRTVTENMLRRGFAPSEDVVQALG